MKKIVRGEKLHFCVEKYFNLSRGQGQRYGNRCTCPLLLSASVPFDFSNPVPSDFKNFVRRDWSDDWILIMFKYLYRFVGNIILDKVSKLVSAALSLRGFECFLSLEFFN